MSAVTDPIRKKSEIKKMAAYWRQKGALRNCLLIVMGVHSALRISDLLSLTWGEVYDFAKGKCRARIELTERKTGKKKCFPLHREAVKAVSVYLAGFAAKPAPGGFIFAAKGNPYKTICRSQAWKIIKEAAKAAEVEGNIAPHSLRKTFGYHAWREKAPLALLMNIYNHSSFATTQRYLGITQDDRDRLYLRLDFFGGAAGNG
ncbi:MAG: tyrosine-type recombinase/integrase [Acidaminococcales bacterium]|jgi:integrase|nr:tyrosine-type recombinase/integrase [Acidaminococcales bacterium]